MSRPDPTQPALPTLAEAARSFLFPVLALVLMVVACAIGGELLLRIAGSHKPNRYGIQDPSMYVPDADPLLSYRMRPGYSGRTYNTDVTLNAQGLRERPLPQPKPAGEFRLLGLGDSFLFGIGTSFDGTVLQVIERLVPPPAGFSTLRTINAGVPGYNTVQEVRWLEREGAAVSPDAVLLLYVLNDAEGIRPLRADGWLDVSPDPPVFPPLPELHPIRIGLFSSHLVTLLNQVLTAGRVAEARRRYVDFYARGVFEDPPSGWHAALGALRRLRSLCADRGLPVFVVVCPIVDLLEDHPFSPGYTRVAEGCAEVGLPCLVPPLDALRNAPPDQLRCHPQDGHCSTLGYRLIGEAIAKYMVDNPQVWSGSGR